MLHDNDDIQDRGSVATRTYVCVRTLHTRTVRTKVLSVLAVSALLIHDNMSIRCLKLVICLER